MAILFSSFPPEEWRIISSTQPFFLQILKTNPGCQKLVLQQDAYTLSLCGHTSVDFSVLMEAENISQNTGCPHFCDSIRNISIKAHIL